MTDPQSAELPDRLSRARLWAASRFPYLAAALFALDVTTEPRLGTAAVDEAWALYVDPAAAASWTVEQFGSLLVHHLGHLLRDHATRARACGVTGSHNRAWGRAADAEINDDLVDAGLEQPGPVVLPADLGAPPGHFAEEYFALDPHLDDPSGGRCGSGADGVTRPWERPGDGRVPPGSAQLLRRQTAQEMVAAGREAGHVPAGWLRWAEGFLHPEVDWRRVLAAEVRSVAARRAGLVDYSYARPSRRSAVSGSVVLPSLRAPAPRIAIVVDTSLSVTGHDLARVLAEVHGIARVAGIDWSDVTVLACDADVQAVRRITRPHQVELFGGGGTDMGAGLQRCGDLRPRPDLVVVLTDGFTPWPAEPPPGVRVVVGLLDVSSPAPPAWARSVRILDRPDRL